MKKIIASDLVSILALSACARRPANPEMIDQVGDNRKTFLTLEAEMRGVQAEI